MKTSATALKAELVGLIIHEISHQFGASETVAKEIQEIYLRRMQLNPLRKLALKLGQTKGYGEMMGLTGELSGILTSSLIYGMSFDSVLAKKLEVASPGSLALLLAKHRVSELREISIPKIVEMMGHLYFPESGKVSIGQVSITHAERVQILKSYSVLVRLAVERYWYDLEHRLFWLTIDPDMITNLDWNLPKK